MTTLSGKTAVVTGASRGIGRASALALAEAGTQVLSGTIEAANGRPVAFRAHEPAKSARCGAMTGGWRLSYYSRIAEFSGAAPAPEHAGGVLFQV